MHGGLSPESHTVLLCLLEKKLQFVQKKVCAWCRGKGGKRDCCTDMTTQSAAACAQVDLANKPQEFVELYHSIIPDKVCIGKVPC